MSGKRKPSTPSNSVSSDEEDVERTPEKHDTSCSDTGYESVGSPGSVSTISVCSEQALEELRTSQPPAGSGVWPGARETSGARPKTQHKKKKSLLTLCPEVPDEPVVGTPKSRYRRDPLPMKMRALPQSFWQQPNANSTSPSTGTLPPLVTTSKDSQDLNDVQPVTPPESRGRQERTRSITVGNTELLFSLFDGVDPAQERKKVAVVKRGRPKKVTSSLPRVSLDDDPYMSSTSEALLPLIPDRGSGPGTPAAARRGGTQILSVVQIPGGGDRETICLPSLSVEHNYSNLLSQLVMKL